MILARSLLTPISVAAILLGQTQPAVEIAKAIDKQILNLSGLPDDIRPVKIQNLAAQIRKQPVKYAAPLATNLAIDGTEGSDFPILQLIADTLTNSLRKLPPNETDQRAGFEMLAELVRYDHTYTPLKDRRLVAAMQKFDVADRKRGSANFILADLNGKKWNLKRMRGRIVVVSFWATWCPPCRREIPDLTDIYERFHSRDLLVLGISDEDAATQRRFLSEHPIPYPLLVDPGQKAKAQFLVQGLPQIFVYNRAGALIAESVARPSRKGLLNMLARAGLQ